jgi:hypothetical protein
VHVNPRQDPQSTETPRGGIHIKGDTTGIKCVQQALALALPASWAGGVFFLLLMQETSVCFVSKNK